MREITLEELLEAGCHFGHQITRQNPKARDFIFEARDNIHIIDLAKTKEGLDEASAFVKNVASKNGSTIIIVGTKRQAQSLVKEESNRAQKDGVDGVYYIANRWIGGILTNFSEVAKNIDKLKDLRERLRDEEIKSRYTKKEIGQWEKERQKLESLYGGIVEMKQLPDVLFIIDTHLEDIAVKEALRMGIPTVGIVDTNADPYVIDHPIPANDDANGSLSLIIKYVTDAWIEGKKNSESRVQNPELAEKKEVTKEEKKATKKREKNQKEEVKGNTEQKPKKPGRKPKEKKFLSLNS